MVQYCENYQDCRRVQQLAYFGETFDPSGCNDGCDVCKKGIVYEQHDVSALALKLCELVDVSCFGFYRLS